MKYLTPEEIITIYPDLFKRIFGYEPDKQIPRTVLVDDKIRGFISGYLLDTENFYISWGGHLDGFKAVRKLWTEGEATIKEAGIKYFISRIPQKNATTQRLLLGMGWYPRGMMQADGLYIEYYKEL